MEKVNFGEYKDKILNALKTRGNLGIAEPVTLVDGFVYLPFQKEISGSAVLGGPNIPMVILLGANSSRIYLFALRSLLPEVKIGD